MTAYLIKHSGGTMAINANSEKDAKSKATSNGATAISSVKKISKK